MSQPAFDFGDEPDTADEITWSVGELADAINGVLRSRFGGGLWVRGEIQGWSERGGHAYFRLVEDGDRGKAAINVQFFANSRMRLRPLLQKHRLRLADGLKVRVFGHLDLYAPSGQLGLKMSGIDPRFTLGELAMQRDEVIRRLVARGVFDRNRGVRLAAAPLRVGVVTSAASAAWADFTHELERCGYAFHLRLVDVRVQGEQAVEMVSVAIAGLGRRTDLDAIVVIRGGGSRTELATFDAEAIATAICECPVPVLTGLGHEIDRSVADEVAHLALKTPTACAAALAERVRAFVDATEQAWAGVARRAEQLTDRAGQRVDDLAHAIAGRTIGALDRADDGLDRRAGQVRERTSRALDRAGDRLVAAATALGRQPGRLDGEARHLGALEAQVRLLDPVNTMARGWSITRGPDGRAVRDASTLAPGDVLRTAFAAGEVTSRVDGVTPGRGDDHDPDDPEEQRR